MLVSIVEKMSDLSETTRPEPSTEWGDDLPPVQPPSAGFIIQLFVVPAVIVLAVIGVWALFGRLAAGEADWRGLVQDLESANPHVYKRAMFGLAQLLDNDRRLGDQGQHLAGNSEIANALSKRLNVMLDAARQDDDIVAFEVYLTRAIGLLDQPDATFPALDRALDSRYDGEVRKGAVTSLALISSRPVVIAPEVEQKSTDAVVGLSQESEPTLRRAAAFTLGLLPNRNEGPASEERTQRLTVMLNDDDWMSAVNAAISLARWKSTAGYPVFLKACTTPVDATDPAAVQDDLTVLRNVLRAIGELSSHWTDAQRTELRTAVKTLAEHHHEQRIRIDAEAALAALQ